MCASGAPVSGSSRWTGGVEETRQVEARPRLGRVLAKQSGLSNWASRRHKQTKLRCAAGEYPLPTRQVNACRNACPGWGEGWEHRPHGVAILTVLAWLDFARAAAAHQLLAARNAQRGQDEDGDGLAAGHDAGDLRSILAGRDANRALL